MSLSKRVVKSMRVEEAMQELNEASEIVQLREAVKPHESKRISEAFQSLSKPGLLSRSELQPGSRTADRHESYRKFLDKVQKTSGDQMVALCAIGLGQSTIAGMKDAVRVRLPARIQEKRAQLESDALKRITDAHLAKLSAEHQLEVINAAPQAEQSSQNRENTMVAVQRSDVLEHELEEMRPPAAQFFGRVFQLTRQDGLSALASEHVRGGVFLTEPYSTGSLPLVTFSISEDLSQEFALQRPQAM